MKSAEESLFSLKQRSLCPLAKSAHASELAIGPVEIPSELLIAASRGLRVFPLIRYSKHVLTKAGIETATSDPARIGFWIRHYRGYPLDWHVATGPGPFAADGVIALEVIGDPGPYGTL